jgi:hypothetical protein
VATLQKGGTFLRADWFPDPIVVAEQVDTMAAELTDMHNPLLRSLPGITKDVQHRFSVGGPGWAPWAVAGGEGPSGPYQRTYKGGASILIKDGDLFAHVGDESSYVVGPNTITYVPLREPADVVTQQGSDVRNIYDRPFMGLDEEGIANVMIAFDIWMDGIIAGAGGSLTGLSPGEAGVIAPGASRISIRGKGGRFIA